MLCLALVSVAASRPSQAQTPGESTLVVDSAETSGIDGRDWDATFPGARTVDAVNRSVLLRFPGLAAQLAANQAPGRSIIRAEVVFDYAGFELAPVGYTVRTGLGEPKWQQDPPRWHVVAWPLRRPWASDPHIGPTFNAYIAGAGYWSKYGAADTAADRYADPIGTTELSAASPEGRLDVTALLSNPSFGADLSQRLRALEEQGLLLKKLETYDNRYKDAGDAYGWAVPTGGHGLTFASPRLVVTFADGEASAPFTIQPATSVDSLAAALAAKGTGGHPTAVMPRPDELQSIAERVVLGRPDWMPDWQLQRVMQLEQIGGGDVASWIHAFQSGDPAQYGKLVAGILATPPRFWKGWDIQSDLLLWYLFRDALPTPVQDHLRAYWESWLMPDVPTDALVHPQSSESLSCSAASDEWRGCSSFFRGGFTRVQSTMNFNHTAAMGALLGGNIVGSSNAMADGRYGLDHLLVRFWSYLDGTSQEMLDHYYLSITLSAQKMFADFGPTAFDRLMGRMALDRTMELLTTAYHPNLRRIVNPSGRARLSGVLVEQDGIYDVLHTLSPQGALLYPDAPLDATVHNMPVHGYDFPAGRAALQTLSGPWAPEWVSNVVDSKPLPYEETATDTTRGNFNPPLWRRTYLGHSYGLASQDLKGGTVDVLAQWNHKREPASSMEDLGTLTLRYSVNQPNLTQTDGGSMPYAGGVVTLQHRNKAIICTRPRSDQDRTLQIAGAGGVTTLATTIALWGFRDPLDWQVYVDGQPVTSYPFSLHADQSIVLRDGVSYVGIIPLAATDLGRNDEVVIEPGTPGPQGDVMGDKPISPALVVNSYNLQRERPIAQNDPLWETITRATYGGFVLELGDQAEYGDFSAFQDHLRAARVQQSWDADAKILAVDYTSGADHLEMGCATDYPQADVNYAVPPGQQLAAIPYRRVNGVWPYLQPGIDRDTTLSLQGSTGRLEKNGAVLVTEPGHKALLQTEPISGTYVGYNPFPDPVAWSLSVPGPMTVKTDGQLGLLKVAVQPGPGKVWIDHATPDDAGTPASQAERLLLLGFGEPPQIVLNGKILSSRLQSVMVDGQPAFVVPLGDP